MTEHSELREKVEEAQDRIFDTLIPISDGLPMPLVSVPASIKPSTRIAAAMDIIAANPEKYSARAIEYMQHQYDSSERMKIANEFGRIIEKLPADSRQSLIDAAEDSLYMDNRTTGGTDVSAIHFLGRAHQFMTVSQKDVYTKFLRGHSTFDKWMYNPITAEDRAKLRQMEYSEIAREFGEHVEKENSVKNVNYDDIIIQLQNKYCKIDNTNLPNVGDLSKDSFVLRKASEWLNENERDDRVGEGKVSPEREKSRVLHRSAAEGQRSENRGSVDGDPSQHKISKYFTIVRSKVDRIPKSTRGVLDKRNRGRSEKCR